MLKLVLRLNALSCIFFGVLFLGLGGPVAAFLGEAPVWLVRGLGALLVGNAALMLASSARQTPAETEIRLFALGDLSWVAATLILVGAGLYVTSLGGIVAALAVAAMVGVFGILQWRLADEAKLAR
jgi:hypothetical protein